jgi:hypothetical protein
MRKEKNKKAAASTTIIDENEPLLNMREIIQKAEIRKWGKAKEKVNL